MLRGVAEYVVPYAGARKAHPSSVCTLVVVPLYVPASAVKMLSETVQGQAPATRVTDVRARVADVVLRVRRPRVRPPLDGAAVHAVVGVPQYDVPVPTGAYPVPAFEADGGVPLPVDRAAAPAGEGRREVLLDAPSWFYEMTFLYAVEVSASGYAGRLLGCGRAVPCAPVERVWAAADILYPAAVAAVLVAALPSFLWHRAVLGVHRAVLLVAEVAHVLPVDLRLAVVAVEAAKIPTSQRLTRVPPAYVAVKGRAVPFAVLPYVVGL